MYRRLLSRRERSRTFGLYRSGECRGLRVLILGKVWPEPSSSAAGVRTAGLIEQLQNNNHEVSFATHARANDHSKDLEARGVNCQKCAPNDEAGFAAIISQLQPEVCIFDRFTTEEQYSWLIRKHRPGPCTEQQPS